MNNPRLPAPSNVLGLNQHLHYSSDSLGIRRRRHERQCRPFHLCTGCVKVSCFGKPTILEHVRDQSESQSLYGRVMFAFEVVYDVGHAVCLPFAREQTSFNVSSVTNVGLHSQRFFSLENPKITNSPPDLR